MDKYKDYGELQKFETEGVDFRVFTRIKPNAKMVVLAPHGGGIEPGTTELATAIAADELNLAIFEGIKLFKNRELHITSTNFDEPRCLNVVERSTTALALHGESSNEDVVFIGGADEGLRKILSATLALAGFDVKKHQKVSLQGCSPNNICNRGISKKGVQLELSKGLREKFFKSLSTEGRQFHTEIFDLFVTAIRQGLYDARMF